MAEGSGSAEMQMLTRSQCRMASVDMVASKESRHELPDASPWDADAASGHFAKASGRNQSRRKYLRAVVKVRALFSGAREPSALGWAIIRGALATVVGCSVKCRALRSHFDD